MHTKQTSLKQKLTGILQSILRNAKIEFSKTLHLSLGENCLTDNILQRHGLKSFSTPYSHGRSNIDYAIKLERENYADLLNMEYLYYDMVGPVKVVRNSRFSQCAPIYDENHQKGFEFTHHDVLGTEDHRKNYKRKIARLQRLKGRKDFKFYYHYRYAANNDLRLVLEKAETFLQYYAINRCKSELIIFTQQIVENPSDRGIVEVLSRNGTKAYILKTMEMWGGGDQDLFWAKKDDDLIAKMLNLAN